MRRHKAEPQNRPKNFIFKIDLALKILSL
jgi:hypothetical protein